MAAAFYLSCMKFRGVKGIPARAPHQPCPLLLTGRETWDSEWWSAITQAKQAEVLESR